MSISLHRARTEEARIEESKQQKSEGQTISNKQGHQRFSVSSIHLMNAVCAVHFHAPKNAVAISGLNMKSVRTLASLSESEKSPSSCTNFNTFTTGSRGGAMDFNRCLIASATSMAASAFRFLGHCKPLCSDDDGLGESVAAHCLLQEPEVSCRRVVSSK